MAKLRKWKEGLKAGNRSSGVTLNQAETLKHIIYNEDTSKLEADRPITTTLNSFFLGGQHSMSSGGENIFFTNITSDIDWFPMWGGLLNQELEENRGASGTIRPSGRTYNDNLLINEPVGPPSPTNTTVYNQVSLTTFNQSIFGFGIQSPTGFKKGQWLLFQTSLHKPGEDFDIDEVKKIIAYEHLWEVEEDVEPYKELTRFFKHPMEIHKDTLLHSRMYSSFESRDGPWDPLELVASAVAPNYVWLRGYFRVFEDKNIAFEHPVYITDVRSSEAISITRAPSPNEEAVVSFKTNTLDVEVDLEWDREQYYEGVVTINGNLVVPTYKQDGTHKATVSVTLDPEDLNLKITRDGARFEIPVEPLETPQILSATLSGIYPGAQTELKAGDIVQISVTTDIPVSQLNFVAGLAEGTNITFPAATEFTVDLVVTNTTTLGLPIAQEITATAIETSEPFTTDNAMVHNNQYPIIQFQGVDYPVGQQALKNSEQATVNYTLQHQDSYITTSNGELNVTLEPQVTRASGDYNTSVDNFTITATKDSNGAVSTNGTVVWIAHLAPTVSIVSPNHLRSGGNDSTAPQDHLITVNSNQRLLNSITLDASIGAWQGSWNYFTTGFSRDLQVHDNDIKGQGTFSNLLVTNLAGIPVTTATGLTYSCQGFVSRSVAIAPFDWQVTINVSFQVSGNLIADWSFKSGITYSSSVTRPQVDKYNLHSVTGDIKLLDKSSTDASSNYTTFTIEET